MIKKLKSAQGGVRQSLDIIRAENNLNNISKGDLQQILQSLPENNPLVNAINERMKRKAIKEIRPDRGLER
ncbi:MAG: hypothetical protein PHE79_07315 [Eubacteriales bacterium]|nr:hypothetical protein [Eubacteriales bacterium]